MKRKVPIMWTLMFGLIWTFYCAQAVAVLHGSPTTAVSQIVVDAGARSTVIQQSPRVHAPYDPFYHTESTAGILPLEEFAGATNEEETEQETKSGLSNPHQFYRYLTPTSTGQVRSTHRRRCEPSIPLYLLLGNLKIYDCIEGLFR